MMTYTHGAHLFTTCHDCGGMTARNRVFCDTCIERDDAQHRLELAYA